MTGRDPEPYLQRALELADDPRALLDLRRRWFADESIEALAPCASALFARLRWTERREIARLELRCLAEEILSQPPADLAVQLEALALEDQPDLADEAARLRRVLEAREELAALRSDAALPPVFVEAVGDELRAPTPRAEGLPPKLRRLGEQRGSELAADTRRRFPRVAALCAELLVRLEERHRLFAPPLRSKLMSVFWFLILFALGAALYEWIVIGGLLSTDAILGRR
jgi:hypothetical protein